MASNNTAAAIDFLSTSLRLITKISSGAKLIAAHTVSYKERQNKSVAVRRHRLQVLMLFITTTQQHLREGTLYCKEQVIKKIGTLIK